MESWNVKPASLRIMPGRLSRPLLIQVDVTLRWDLEGVVWSYGYISCISSQQKIEWYLLHDLLRFDPRERRCAHLHGPIFAMLMRTTISIQLRWSLLCELRIWRSEMQHMRRCSVQVLLVLLSLGMILLLRGVCGPSEGLSVAPSSDFLVCTGGQSRKKSMLPSRISMARWLEGLYWGRRWWSDLEWGEHRYSVERHSECHDLAGWMESELNDCLLEFNRAGCTHNKQASA